MRKLFTHCKRIEPCKIADRPLTHDLGVKTDLCPRNGTLHLERERKDGHRKTCASRLIPNVRKAYIRNCAYLFLAFSLVEYESENVLVSGLSATMADRTAQRQTWSFQAGLAAVSRVRLDGFRTVDSVPMRSGFVIVDYVHTKKTYYVRLIREIVHIQVGSGTVYI